MESLRLVHSRLFPYFWMTSWLGSAWNTDKAHIGALQALIDQRTNLFICNWNRSNLWFFRIQFDKATDAGWVIDGDWGVESNLAGASLIPGSYEDVKSYHTRLDEGKGRGKEGRGGKEKRTSIMCGLSALSWKEVSEFRLLISRREVV